MKVLKPESSLLKELLSVIRNKNTPYYTFRNKLERLGELLIYEALKELKLREVISVVSAPEGIKRLEKFTRLTIITASVDERLNSNGYIVPGLGDAGDRFCGTEKVEVVESHGV